MDLKNLLKHEIYHPLLAAGGLLIHHLFLVLQNRRQYPEAAVPELGAKEVQSSPPRDWAAGAIVPQAGGGGGQRQHTTLPVCFGEDPDHI